MPDEFHRNTLAYGVDAQTGGDSPERVDPEQVDLVTGSLEAVLDLFETEDEINVVLGGLCRQVVQAFPAALDAAITVIRPSGPVTVASTSREVLPVEAAQLRFDDAPCLSAARSRAIVRTDIATARERWPEFAAIAQQANMHSYLSVPLLIDAEYSGALNLYGEFPHAFHRMDESLLELYVVAAGSALRSARRYSEARVLVEGLRVALRSRAVIDQAKGIVMALRGIDAEEAFRVLVERSQHENVKLRVVAERAVRAVARRNAQRSRHI